MAEQGLDYYLTHRAAWPGNNFDIDMEGIKAVIGIVAEQTGKQGRASNPEEFVDLSYQRQALKELGFK